MPNAHKELLLDFPIVLPDGRNLVYGLRVVGAGAVLTAGEVQSGGCKLPHFCPERHIIGNGEFCMYWEGDQRLDVTDEQSANVWLQVLTNFLINQSRAAYLRRWPSGEAWAHGWIAARAQQRAETHAKALGGPMAEWLLERRLAVERAQGSVFRVHLDGDPLFSSWVVVRRAARHKSRRLVLRTCETTPHGSRMTKKYNRAYRLRELAMALWEWEAGERKFWVSCAGETCCRTMDVCGLKALNAESPDLSLIALA